jgi:hypothetical protein
MNLKKMRVTSNIVSEPSPLLWEKKRKGGKKVWTHSKMLSLGGSSSLGFPLRPSVPSERTVYERNRQDPGKERKRKKSALYPFAIVFRLNIGKREEVERHVILHTHDRTLQYPQSKGRENTHTTDTTNNNQTRKRTRQKNGPLSSDTVAS